MNRSFDLIFRISFSLFFLALAAGIYFLMRNDRAYEQTLMVGTAACTALMVCGLWEVLTSRRIKPAEKIAWVLVLLVFTVIGALFYYFGERKRIASESLG